MSSATKKKDAKTKSIGLFEDDCERPACDDIKQALPKSLEELHAMSKKHNANQPIQCPPKKSELGRSSWKLLHTMAAWYPENPTKEQEEKMSNFMSALAEFYPCTWCAQDFKESLEKKPVMTESRKDLCVWLCEQHNLVNQKLGKPIFKCDMKHLDERWRKSTNPKCTSG